jgi:hypothetical protein
VQLALASGWTGGQYSLYRALLGCYLAVHFAALVPWGAELFSSEGTVSPGSVSPLLHLFPNALALIDTPAFVTALLAAATAAAACLIAGWKDRAAAIF